MTHGGKRKLFDDPNQPPQARAHHAEHLESDVGMRQTESLEILLPDKEQRGVIHRGSRGRVVAAIENRHFGDRTAGAIDAEHLLAAARRTLEDADVPALHDVQSRARLALAEHHFPGSEMARHGAFGQKLQLRIREAGEDGNLRQRSPKLRARFSHAAYCSERAGGCRRGPPALLIGGGPGAASEWQAQPQHSFAMPFFVKISDSGQQQIVERNHSGQLPVIAVDHRKPCETGLGHPQHGGAQRLIGMSHNGLPQHVG